MNAIARSMLVASVFFSLSITVSATAKEIFIGSVVPMSGPLAAIGKPLSEGASACFDMINANGGLNGYQIRFEQKDDQSDPKLTVAKTQELLAAYPLVAMINTAGSLSNAALIESGILRRANIALVGPRDGSSAVREMKSPNHYFLIAGVGVEADKIIKVSTTIGRKRMVAVYSDDGSGHEAFKQIERAAAENGATLVAGYPVPAGGNTIPDIAKKIAEDNSVHQVLVYGVTPVVAQLYKEIKTLRPALPVTSFSTTSHAAIVDLLGPEASRGLMLSQVTYPPSSVLQVMKDFRSAMDMLQIPEIRQNSLHLEGFLAARVVVEALKKAQGAPTREGVIAALNQINRSHIGDLGFDFTNGKREGSTFVQIGIIGAQGKLVN
jgi:branched-chain amino acid transport system substrate-binding protein